MAEVEDIDLGNGMMLRQRPEGSYTYPKTLPTEGDSDPFAVAAARMRRSVVHDRPLTPYEAPTNKPYIVEPDLVEAQQGHQELPTGYRYNDQNIPYNIKTGKEDLPVAQRPAILPVAMTPNGDRWAMPKIGDIASNIMGGIGAPAVATKAGEVVLGSGAVKTAAQLAQDAAEAERGLASVRVFGKQPFKTTPVEGNPFAASDDAARLARAKEQGYHIDEPVYHETNKDFSEFKPGYGTQVWFTTDKSTLGQNGAAGQGKVIEAYLKHKKLGGWKEYDKYGTDELIAMGYDGLRLDKDIVIFDPKAVRRTDAKFDPAKSDSGNLLYSDTRNQVYAQAGHELEKRGPFYSALENAVGDAKLGKASADQWLGYLRNQPGVKSEEINTVLRDLPSGQITKEQLQGIVKDNGVKLKEITKGGKEIDPDTIFQQAKDHVEENYPQYNPGHPQYERLLDEKVSELEKAAQSSTKYHSYQLPGSEPGSYKEMLLTLPSKKTKAGELPEGYQLIDENAASKAAGYNVPDDAPPRYMYKGHGVSSRIFKSKEEAIAEARKTAEEMGNAATFKSSHWDEPNILAHIRHNDRNLPVPFTDAEKAALAQHEAAAPKLEATRNQQAEVAKEIGKVAKPLEAARKSAILSDLKAGKISNGDAMRQLENYESPKEIKPLQDKLDALRKQEDDLRKSLPIKPEPKTSKTLHLEEWQSDLHQAGRDRGYVGEKEKLQPEFDKIEKKLMDTNDEKLLGQPTVKGVLKEAVEKKIITQEEANTYKRYSDIENQTPVPDLPFKKNWEELALKKALHKAASEGYEGLSWTPGEAQALRYQNDVRTKLSSIDWHNKNMGKVDPEGNKQILVTTAHGSEIELTVDKHGEIIKGRPELKGKGLDSVLGKDIARQVLEKSEGNVDAKNYVMNSEGMKAAYDKRGVDILNNIAKKYHTKVEMNKPSNYILKNKHGVEAKGGSTLEEAEKSLANKLLAVGDKNEWKIVPEHPVHIIPITPELRTRAKQGFNLFSSVPVTVPVDFDPWERKYDHHSHAKWRDEK